MGRKERLNMGWNQEGVNIIETYDRKKLEKINLFARYIELQFDPFS